MVFDFEIRGQGQFFGIFLQLYSHQNRRCRIRHDTIVTDKLFFNCIPIKIEGVEFDMIQQPRTNFSFQTFLSRTWKRSTSGIHKSGGEGSRLSIYIPGNNEGYGPLSKGIIDQPSCNRDEWSCYFTICLRAALKRARALDPRATVISNTAPV